MRRVFAGLAGAVVFIILAWIGVWFYAEMRLQQLVEAKINQINSTGHEQVTYDRLETSKSPLVAGLTLINPQMKVTVDPSEPPVVISTARLGAHINLFHPLTLHIVPALRVTLTNQGGSFVIAAAKARITERLNPSVWQGNTLAPVSSGSAVFTQINTLASNGSLELAQIDSLSVHETLNVRAGKDHPAITMTENMQNFRLSPLLTKLFGLPFNGQINDMNLSLMMSGPLNWQEIAKQETASLDDNQRTKLLLGYLHQWAEAGGHANGSLNIWVGPTRLRTGFTLGFDKQTQPEGDTKIIANNLGEFSNALVTAYPGLQGWVSVFQAELAPYISTTPQNGQMLNLHIKYGQDGVFVGDKKTGAMPHLDWQALIGSVDAPILTPQSGSSGAAL